MAYSITVELDPSKTYAFKLEAPNYLPLEFSHTTGTADETITKTLIPEKATFKITAASIVYPPSAIYYPGDIIGLSVTIKNEGNKADTGKLTMRWDTVTAPTQVRSFTEPIAAGSSKTFTDVAFGVPDDATPGAHTIKMEIKPDSEPAATGTYDVPITITKEKGTLSVSSSPTGASVAISGITGTFTTPFTKDLDPGTYTLTITKSGYVDVTDTITITTGVTTTKSYTLVLEKGTLSVSTSPTGASVKVGPETKTAPCTFSLTPGTHTVTITRTGYVTRTDSVTISAGVTTTKSYTLVLEKGTLSVSTSPTGAGVSISGVTGTFTTPFSTNLLPGTYTLTITKSGYVTQTPSVTITADVTTTKSYTLVAAKVKVTITVNAPNTKLYVDGALIGTLM